MSREGIRLKISHIPDLGKFSLFKDLLEHWEKTGEGLNPARLKKETSAYNSRSGSAVRKYIKNLREEKLVVDSRLYTPKPVVTPLPGPELGISSYRVMQRISNVLWRVKDRNKFRDEIKKHSNLKCTNCGYIIKGAILPRRPCPNCFSPMIKVYNRIFKET